MEEAEAGGVIPEEAQQLFTLRLTLEEMTTLASWAAMSCALHRCDVAGALEGATHIRTGFAAPGMSPLVKKVQVAVADMLRAHRARGIPVSHEIEQEFRDRAAGAEPKKDTPLWKDDAQGEKPKE